MELSPARYYRFVALPLSVYPAPDYSPPARVPPAVYEDLPDVYCRPEPGPEAPVDSPTSFRLPEPYMEVPEPDSDQEWITVIRPETPSHEIILVRPAGTRLVIAPRARCRRNIYCIAKHCKHYPRRARTLRVQPWRQAKYLQSNYWDSEESEDSE